MADNPVKTELYDALRSEVHIWYCDPLAIQNKSKLAAYESILSADEAEQYQRFHYEKDRHSYLVSHALLRSSLSKYSDAHASSWGFSRNAHGKPGLAAGSSMAELRFNLTHTERLSACVIALNKSCGIDAESTNRKNKLDAVAKRMFADEELRCLDESNIQHQFYYYWTLREAYVKAKGTGLSGSSKDFYFDLDINEMTADVHRLDGKQAEDEQWQFRLYEPSSEHVLALAYESDQPVRVKIAEFFP